MLARILRSISPVAALTAALALLAAPAPAQIEAVKVAPAQSGLIHSTTENPVPEIEGPKNGFVWMIEHKSMNKPCFLFGTMHAGDKRFLKFNDTVKVMFKSADAVYTELDMDLMEKEASKLASSMMLPEGKYLTDYVDADVLKDLDKLFMEVNMGVNVATLNRFKPIAVSMQLEQLKMMKRYGSAKALDMKIYDAAKRKGKEVGGVEFLDEQLNAFNVLTNEEAGRILRKVARMGIEDLKEGRDRLGELAYYYLLGDEKKIYDYMMQDQDPNDKLEAKFMKALLDDRNVVMAERCAKMMKENPDKIQVFAFGTLHFVGPVSVNKMLTEKGFKVTRLTAPE
jgi:uncharacterized protein